MDFKLRYALSTYNRPDILEESVLAALNSSLVPHEIIVIDNSADKYAGHVLYNVIMKYHNVYVIPQTTNIGLSGAWNWYLETYDDFLLFPNDDVIVHPHTIRAMVHAAITQPEQVLFFGAKDAFSFFLLKKKAYNKIGGFDPAFHPIYFDDNDYAYRLKLAGYEPVVVSDATFEHLHGGSSTLKAYTPDQMADHHRRFVKNQNYYISKWGGLPGYEKYTTPFNRGK